MGTEKNQINLLSKSNNWEYRKGTQLQLFLKGGMEELERFGYWGPSETDIACFSTQEQFQNSNGVIPGQGIAINVYKFIHLHIITLFEVGIIISMFQMRKPKDREVK